MKYYIATGLENAAQAVMLHDLISTVPDMEITYNWMKHGSVKEDLAKLEEVCIAEMEGICNADVVIVLMPGGRGTHTEFGMALAWGKAIILCSPGEDGHAIFEPGEATCAFYHAPQIFRVQTVADVIGILWRLDRFNSGMTTPGAWIPPADTD